MLKTTPPLRTFTLYPCTFVPLILLLLEVIRRDVVGAATVSQQQQDNISPGFFIRLLCRLRIFRSIEFCRNKLPPETNVPTTSPITFGAIIDTASELQSAFDKVPTTITTSNNANDPGTVIEIWHDRIVVPPMFDIPVVSCRGDTMVKINQFGFRIESKNIHLICKIKTTIDADGNCILDATNGGGIFYLNNAQFRLTGFTLTNGGNILHTAGAAFYETNRTSLTLTNVTISNNVAKCGGPIYSNNTESIERASSAAGDKKEMISLYNTKFIGNKALYGGAIYASNTILTGYNTVFDSNQAGLLGGAVALNAGCNTTFQNTTFTNNYSGGSGGAVHTSGINGNATFIQSIFRSNSGRNYVSACV